ncbi:hypothetical protein [Streptomyces sp. NPDC059828]|uniref:hypothetical protein n=1 Tax=Streptomyces sp. NPDC059828 TaxID=3346965 RepID=UPI003669D712
MPFLALGGVPLLDCHLLRTLARATDSRKEYMIITAALVLACVINGDTVSGVLEQATRLVVVITVLVIVQTLAGVVGRKRTDPSLEAGPDISL